LKVALIAVNMAEDTGVAMSTKGTTMTIITMTTTTITVMATTTQVTAVVIPAAIILVTKMDSAVILVGIATVIRVRMWFPNSSDQQARGWNLSKAQPQSNLLFLRDKR
jgi:hypothetical protein